MKGSDRERENGEIMKERTRRLCGVKWRGGVKREEGKGNDNAIDVKDSEGQNTTMMILLYVLTEWWWLVFVVVTVSESREGGDDSQEKRREEKGERGK